MCRVNDGWDAVRPQQRKLRKQAENQAVSLGLTVRPSRGCRAQPRAMARGWTGCQSRPKTHGVQDGWRLKGQCLGLPCGTEDWDSGLSSCSDKDLTHAPDSILSWAAAFELELVSERSCSRQDIKTLIKTLSPRLTHFAALPLGLLKWVCFQMGKPSKQCTALLAA